MPLRNQHPVDFRPRGVTDSIDGSNAASGSMGSSADLVPSMHTAGVWVPRPAAYKMIDFSSFVPPITGEWLTEIGSRVYGIVASGRFPGQSEPFCYDFTIGGFVPIQGVTAANTPKSLPTTGEWIPCTSVQVGGWLLFSHEGFSLPNAFGWLDQTGFKDSAVGDVGFTNQPAIWGVSIWGVDRWAGLNPAGGPFVSNLSKNIDLAGWRPGQVVTDSAGVIPANTRIVDVDGDGAWIELDNPSSGPAVKDSLTVAGGTKAMPLWAAGNVTANPLPGVARAISLFFGRAYYAVANALNFSDAGDPLVKSAASQVETLENGLDITALAPQPFNNATQIGGVVNALVIFQGDSGMWQLTGDRTLNNVLLNEISPLGTLAPLTIQTTPEGLRFVAPDGARMLQLDGTLSPPLSAHGEGVALPFINAAYPSRMCAAFNEDVYRVSVTTYPAIDGSPIGLGPITNQEWWYHLKLGGWSGPHSFPAKLIVSTDRPATNHGFVMFPLDSAPGGSAPLPELWFSNTRQLIDSLYAENGVPLKWIYRTSLLPDTETMFQNMAVETLLAIALAPVPGQINPSLWGSAIWGHAIWGQRAAAVPPGIWGQSIWGQAIWGTGGNTGQVAMITARNELGQVLNQVTLQGFSPPANATQLPYATPGIWGVAVWGGSLWGAQSGGAIFAQRRVPWTIPLNFKQMTVEVTGLSGPNVAIGNLRLRYQQLGYQVVDPAYVISQTPVSQAA